MMPKAERVSQYDFTPEDQLFLDTNIWLYVYGPQKPDAKWVKPYSQALARILTARSHIYIDVLVVSEFINAYARLKWKLVRPTIQFKEFRNTPEFKPVAQEIVDNTKRVVNHCSRIESGFSTLKINNLLDGYAAGGADFNDQMIIEMCKTSGLILVTNDSDFKDKGIPVLTANQHLLS